MAERFTLPETEAEWARLAEIMAELALARHLTQIQEACDAKLKRVVRLVNRLNETVIRTGIGWDELERRLDLALGELTADEVN